MWCRSITLRLTLLFATISTAVLLSSGAFVALAVQKHFEEQDHAELAGKLELTRHALAKVRNQKELAALPQLLQDALVGHPGLSVIAIQPDQEVLFATSGAYFPSALLERARSGVPLEMPSRWDHGEHSYRGLIAQASTAIPDQGPFTIAVALDIGHHQDFMQAFTRTLWVALALGVLFAALLGWFAARQGLAPARRIAQVAKGITPERMQERLPLASVPSELHDLAVSFNAMLARLEDAFRRLSNFSSDLAHELRAPVSNLLTQTQVALSKPRASSEYQDILASNLEEYERLSRMISDMLFLAKADHGLIVPHREPIDVAREALDLLEFYEPLADEKRIKLMTVGSGQLIGDRLMLRRALSNLLSNALRHSRVGGTVQIAIEHGEHELVIQVSNPGEPIPAEHQKHLFDRFYRIDAARERSSDGAGLGLALTKSIVEAHAGRIGVVSEGGTTCFIMHFPLPPAREDTLTDHLEVRAAATAKRRPG